MISPAGWAYESEGEPDWEPDFERFSAFALEVAERWRDARPARAA